MGAESFSLSELTGAKIDGVAVPEQCAPSADVDGADIDHLCGQSLSRCRFENTGLYHVPALHGELDGARDPLRGRRGRGWRTGSSSLSVKKCSSSTFSCSQARCLSFACAARAEAGGGHDSFVSLFDRCEDLSTRFHRVTSVMHDNLGSTPHAFSTARNSQYAHSRATGLHGRVSLSSVNSVGDIEAGRTSLLCMMSLLIHSRRPESCMKRRGQAFLQKPGLKISQEVEIIPGCAVTVTCPLCPSNSLVSPGPGRVTRNMLGWLGKEGIVPHSVVGRWRFLVYLFVCLRARPSCRATYWRAVLATASRCVEGYRTPDEAMVC